MLADDIVEAREELLDTNHTLALGVHAVCLAHIDRPELVDTYSVGGAAMMHSVHQEVYDFWQFEKSLQPDIDQ